MLFGLSWGLGPADVDGVGALDSGWFAYLKARGGYERLPRPKRFLVVYPGSTSAWRASSFPL